MFFQSARLGGNTKGDQTGFYRCSLKAPSSQHFSYASLAFPKSSASTFLFGMFHFSIVNSIAAVCTVVEARTTLNGARCHFGNSNATVAATKQHLHRGIFCFDTLHSDLPCESASISYSLSTFFFLSSLIQSQQRDDSSGERRDNLMMRVSADN